MGLKVIALDVSLSALEVGQKLYSRHPIFGDQPKPQFLFFDGETINLADQSVDRITCLDAFHHVPNPQHVIKEMGRVLRQGGIVGFSEPGPNHSKTGQSQYEMRANRVIENDVNLREIWSAAQEAGFTNIKVSVFNVEPVLLSLDEFEDYLSSEHAENYVAPVREQMRERRLFFLYKGDAMGALDSRRLRSTRSNFIKPQISEITHRLDSRRRAGLRAELRVSATLTQVRAGDRIHLNVSAKNTGRAVWLPTPEIPPPWRKRGPLARFGTPRYMGPDRVSPRVGGVRLGLQLLSFDGELLDIDYFRYHLTPNEGREIHPGEKVEFSVAVPMLRRGNYILQCDLVSEHVCWFERTGMAPRLLAVEVI
jgi:hypothetical protein